MKKEVMIRGCLKYCKAVREYKRGREKNFFLWSNENGTTFFLDKFSSGCTYTVKAGSENDVLNFIDENKFKMVALHA